MSHDLSLLKAQVNSFVDGNISPVNLAGIVQRASTCFLHNEISLRQYRVILFGCTSCIDGDFSALEMLKYGEFMRDTLK